MNIKALFLVTIIGGFSLMTHAEQSFFAGVEAFTGRGNLDAEVNTDNPDSSINDLEVTTDQTGQTLVLGLLGQNNIRTALKYTSIKAETETNSKFDLTGLDLDWTFGFAETPQILPYSMIGFGYYTWQDSGEAFGLDDENLDGVAFNLGLGAIFKVHQRIELDASYRYKGIYWQRMKNSDGSVSVDSTSTNYNLTLGARVLF